MLDKFNHIRKLSGLYDVAIEHQNNEIRLHTADVGLVSVSYTHLRAHET